MTTTDTRPSRSQTDAEILGALGARLYGRRAAANRAARAVAAATAEDQS